MPAHGSEATSQVRGRYRAVLIGSGEYKAPELPALKAPPQDVAAFARVLRDRKECGFDKVLPLVDPELQTMRVELNRAFKDCEHDDLLLLYFSGHGKLSPGGEGQLHLCVRETETDLLPATSYCLTELRELINKYPISRVIIILDCCFSGAARMALKGDLPGMLENSLGQGRGKFLLTSSKAWEPSAERAGDECSVFTKFLIEGMETEAADENPRDGIITIEELFRYAQRRMAEEKIGQQPERFNFDASPGDVIMWRSQRTSPTQRAAPLQPDRPDLFVSVRDLLDRRQIIPFIGAGTYGGGLLNNFALATALAERAGLQSQESLPATAEYCARFWGVDERDEVVGAFAEILRHQSAQLTPPSTHQLISELAPPWVIVSATYDMVLEDRLTASGVPLVIVSHILRSRGEMHNGVIVLRPGRPAEICAAGDFLFDAERECVIYKILGSPFLHAKTNPALELDSLVLTETDHLTFLGRLAHEITRVPPSIKLHLDRRKLLYLGYSLDIWHYRLVQNVFRGRKPQSFAVRQPTSQMESLMWQRLGTDVIKSDPEEFAKTLLSMTTSAASAAS
jgi:hypothetical protein